MQYTTCLYDAIIYTLLVDIDIYLYISIYIYIYIYIYYMRVCGHVCMYYVVLYGSTVRARARIYIYIYI
jgi:hypothetical protein